MTTLTVSLVTYHPDQALLRTTLSSLRRAVGYAQEAGSLARADLILVDNGDDRDALKQLADSEGWSQARILSGHGNVGFGRGHNLAIGKGTGDFHLILNPDVDLARDALHAALGFMAEHGGCGLLSPRVADANGESQYLCKRYPSVFDLFLRGFMPGFVKRLFAARLARYDMRDHADDRILWDPPIVSGCFMFFRSGLLHALGGFEPSFFLYFEDFDLSLRAGQLSHVVAVDAVRIVHFGGGAGRKGWHHIRLFGDSAWLFFDRHGWKWS